MDARAWLTAERRIIDAGTWVAPSARNRAQQPATLKAFANAWLKYRQLKPRTVAFYRSLVDQKILPELGDVPLKDFTSQTVRDWPIHATSAALVMPDVNTKSNPRRWPISVSVWPAAMWSAASWSI